jgi:hypothetical protein
VDVDRSVSIASFQELIFASEDGDAGGGFDTEAFRFLDKSEIKIYNHLLGSKSHEGHMSRATNACEAGRMFSTHHRALDSDLELQDPCKMTWVPMSCLLASIRPETPTPWSLSVNEH